MTTIERANRIVWFTASRIIRRERGSWTFVSTWVRVEPIDVAASTVLTGTRRIPRAVMRTAGGIA